MRIEEIRSEFRVVFVDENSLSSTELCNCISELGYQTQVYPTFDSALVSIRSLPPHMLVMSYSRDETLSDRFLNEVRRISPETQIILLINDTQVIASIMKNSIGEIFDYLTVPLVSSLELLIRLDRAAQQLYLKFENEQLRKRRGNLAIAEPSLGDLSFEEDESGQTFQRLHGRLQELETIRDQEELIKKYIFQLASICGSMPVLYLRFLPAQMSFVHSQGIWTPLAEVKNLGFRLESMEPQALAQLKANTSSYPALKVFMDQVFQIDEFGALLHFEAEQLRGIAIVFNKSSLGEKYPEAILLHEFFENLFARNSLLKEFHNQQITDAETGLLNQKTLDDELANEISRARRIRLPLSMMKIKFDNYHLLSQKYGDEALLAVVKALAKSMKKNFRTTDVLARTDKHEFCFLLPHTDVKNTLVKAEKIRRAFNQSKFQFLKIEDKAKLTISIGVSEYPSLSADGASLTKSCDEALFQVARSQGNQVAVWRAETGFKPDFSSSQNRNAE